MINSKNIKIKLYTVSLNEVEVFLGIYVIIYDFEIESEIKKFLYFTVLGLF